MGQEILEIKVVPGRVDGFSFYQENGYSDGLIGKLGGHHCGVGPIIARYQEMIFDVDIDPGSSGFIHYLLRLSGVCDLREEEFDVSTRIISAADDYMLEKYPGLLTGCVRKLLCDEMSE